MNSNYILVGFAIVVALLVGFLFGSGLQEEDAAHDHAADTHMDEHMEKSDEGVSQPR